MVKITGFKTGKAQIKVGRIVSVCFITVLCLSVVQGQVKSESPVSPSASLLKIAHGAHIPPTVNYGQVIASFNSLTQKDLAIVMYFLDWTNSGQNGIYFDTFLVDKIYQTFHENSPAIMLTWQPMNGKRPGCIKDYGSSIPLNDIITGACDNYIRNFARAIKARPERYLIRFAHEMNISHTVWWPGHYGQDSSAYILMYRHVYDVFMAENVNNAEWVWSPNYWSYPAVDWNHRNMYYPGDNYVDWIGVDGYNWYQYLGSSWVTFSDLYESGAYNYVFKDLACRYAKPQIIAEFASVEGPGGNQSKSYWIQDAYNRIPQHPFLRGAVWFNDYAFGSPNHADFRVTTSTAQSLPSGTGGWTNAYRQAISKPVYSPTLQSLEDATPPSTYCGDGEAQYITPAWVIVQKNWSVNFNLTGLLYDQDLSLSLSVPTNSGITATINPNSLKAPWGSTTITIQTSLTTPIGHLPITIQGNGVDIASLQVYVLDRVYQGFIPIIRKY